MMNRYVRIHNLLTEFNFLYYKRGPKYREQVVRALRCETDQLIIALNFLLFKSCVLMVLIACLLAIGGKLPVYLYYNAIFNILL